MRSDETAGVLLVTSRPTVRDHVARLAAAVGVPVEVRDDVEAAGRRWLDAGLVLLGDDAAALGAPVRRSGVVVVAGEATGDRVWRLAVEAGAEQVALLPRDEGWLLERLAGVADTPDGAGLVVGVVGGSGGAGASVLAAALASTAGQDGREVLLVDGDPLGGGLDLVLGAEEVPGLRWEDLVDVRGVVRGSLLREALPSADGVRVLSWGRSGAPALPAAAVEAVLDAGRRSHDLVVVDLPRRDDPPTLAALWRLDVLLLVVPAEVRAAAAAARWVDGVVRRVGDVRLVVRGRERDGLAAHVVAEAVGLPLADRCGHDRGLAAALDRGEPPGWRRRSPLTRLCRRLLTTLTVPERAAVPWLSTPAAPVAARTA